MKWTERRLQGFRELYCYEKLSSACEDCLKTKDDIDNCYSDIEFEE